MWTSLSLKILSGCDMQDSDSDPFRESHKAHSKAPKVTVTYSRKFNKWPMAVRSQEAVYDHGDSPNEVLLFFRLFFIQVIGERKIVLFSKGIQEIRAQTRFFHGYKKSVLRKHGYLTWLFFRISYLRKLPNVHSCFPCIRVNDILEVTRTWTSSTSRPRRRRS